MHIYNYWLGERERAHLVTLLEPPYIYIFLCIIAHTNIKDTACSIYSIQGGPSTFKRSPSGVWDLYHGHVTLSAHRVTTCCNIGRFPCVCMGFIP